MTSSLRSVSILLLSTFIMMLAVGLQGMLIPLRGAAEGWNRTEIAWIGTFYALAFTAGCVATPALVRRVGHIRVFAAFQALLGTSLLLHAMIPDPLAWCAFRAIGGFALSGAYMIIESWLNERVDNENRGAIFAGYMISSMAGVGAGQFILPLGEVGTSTLFMVAAVLYSMAMLPIAFTTAPSPQPLARAALDLKALYFKTPAALVGSFVAGIIFGNWTYFGPLYGQSVGLSSTGIAGMMTAAMVGGTIFQVPFGRLSDRIDRRYVMALAGFIGVAVSVAMIAIKPEQPAAIIGGVFALGSVLFTIYALNVAHASDKAGPGEFLQVSGGLLIAYGIGTMIGPQVGGRLMDASGPSGFFMAMALLYAIYGLHALWRSSRVPAVENDKRTDFKVLPASTVQTPETAVLDGRSDDL
ncbi:MFS transporter (plasmid) [Aminobacter sp. Y103A]|uniref:MFS transporter n=1 Tax=Aminobacter sp. Y103A TaxID=1870862 RepID=UPI002572CF7D|nr:MFS transporter [Aminobacter sp. SS-2016]BBD41089.1 MFS transporter [Aminobacter sp. SS-2016]